MPATKLQYSAHSPLAQSVAKELGLIAGAGAIETATRDGWTYLRTTLLKPGEGRYIREQAIVAGFRAVPGGYRRPETPAAKAAQARLDDKHANSEQGRYEAEVARERAAEIASWDDNA